MDEKNTQEAVHTDAPKAENTQQSAQDDLQKVANRAKAATEGFDFGKLFSGRIDETNYMYGAIGGFVLGLLLNMIPVIGFLISLALLVVGVGVTVRRLHDIDQDGIFAIGLIIPVVGLLMVIYLCWKIGTVGKNRFGDAPDKKRDVFRALLNT